MPGSYPLSLRVGSRRQREDFSCLISSSKEPALCTVCALAAVGGGVVIFGSEQDHCSWGRGLTEAERICGHSLHRGAQTSNQRAGFLF